MSAFTNTITITKRLLRWDRAQHNRRLRAVFEQAFHVIGQVREWLNLLRLPEENLPDTL
jgi:hypothetical protein